MPLMRRVHVNYGHGELSVELGLVSLESPANWVNWTEEYLWDNWGTKERTRDRCRDFLNPGVCMLHAVKMSAGTEVKEFIKGWVDTVQIV